ncbi:MAG: ATP-binding protein [Candidatus Micrarchaeota archaeon]|nr:ATP-binding protein [Candidatus Micrarchaeota archaeon]
MANPFESTAEIKIPSDLFERIIGQEEAVRIAKMIPKQRRHLLLVGPPGTGKSLIAQAIASVLSRPFTEISVLHNEQAPERPIVEIRSNAQITQEQQKQQQVGKIVLTQDVPSFVAEKLGFRCKRCGIGSDFNIAICPKCGAEKFAFNGPTYFEDALHGILRLQKEGNARVNTMRVTPDGRQETVIYERTADGKITVLTQSDIKKLNELNKKSQRKIIIPLARSTFVQASGASETELLGDVRHDPYGGHFQLGTPPYQRVLPGAVHEAHEGVLFVDELSTLGNVQRHILTAMQDKHFPIVGRNPTSSGAIVRVDSVPCNFILVGAVNINDLQMLSPALRSRVRGDGYELLMQASMQDNEKNQNKLYQFMAQEIAKDGKIPHASFAAAEELLNEARRIAKVIDNSTGISLRLRNLAGIIKLAGDIAMTENSVLIEKAHVKLAVQNSRSIEEQLKDKYDSAWKVGSADYGVGTPKSGPETA